MATAARLRECAGYSMEDTDETDSQPYSSQSSSQSHDSAPKFRPKSKPRSKQRRVVPKPSQWVCVMPGKCVLTVLLKVALRDVLIRR